MKSSNYENILKLKTKIENELRPIINNDYVLLDIPNHRNIGDTLIWEGELTFLKKLPYSMKYTCNSFTFSDKKIQDNSIILFHGGGNFGDVWRETQLFRNEVIKKFVHHKIVIFPQTVHYQDKSLMKLDAELYSKHPDLTICARDIPSYELLKDHFSSNTILLLPDMAFCLDLSKYVSKTRSEKVLFLERMDKELNQNPATIAFVNTLKEEYGENLEIKDWPGFFRQGSLRRKLQSYLIKFETLISRKMIVNPLFKHLVHDVYGLKRRDNKDRLLLKGIDFINQYDVIYSTRLHGFILSVLLDKKVNIIDNSYGKNSNFYNTWLKDFNNVSIIGIEK